MLLKIGWSLEKMQPDAAGCSQMQPANRVGTLPTSGSLELLFGKSTVTQSVSILRSNLCTNYGTIVTTLSSKLTFLEPLSSQVISRRASVRFTKYCMIFCSMTKLVERRKPLVFLVKQLFDYFNTCFRVVVVF